MELEFKGWNSSRLSFVRESALLWHRSTAASLYSLKEKCSMILSGRVYAPDDDDSFSVREPVWGRGKVYVSRFLVLKMQ